ncbi:protein S100-A6-like isoform X2 [Amblyraja radiata]|nr:protein S100-A6-like isoform X2 [Amblyraja radiata]
MGTPLEEALTNIKDIFKKYAKPTGKKDTLDLAELKKLLREEITMLDKEKLEQFADKVIEHDKSKDIDFPEFMRILAALATCNKSSGDCQQSSGCAKST